MYFTAEYAEPGKVYHMLTYCCYYLLKKPLTLLVYTNYHFFGVLHVHLIAFSWFIGANGTDFSVGIRLLSGETLLQ